MTHDVSGLGAALFGGAVGFVSGAASLVFALTHAVAAWRTPPWTPDAWRRMAITWGIVAAGFLVATALIGGNVDQHLAPFVLPAVLFPMSMALLSIAMRNQIARLHGRKTLTGHAIIAGNRLAPLAWLAAVAAITVFVFPKT